ncbi:hypothetical protein KEM52_003781, partial [Ascosphaera acerosa]
MGEKEGQCLRIRLRLHTMVSARLMRRLSSLLPLSFPRADHGHAYQRHVDVDGDGDGDGVVGAAEPAIRRDRRRSRASRLSTFGHSLAAPLSGLLGRSPAATAPVASTSTPADADSSVPARPAAQPAPAGQRWIADDDYADFVGTDADPLLQQALAASAIPARDADAEHVGAPNDDDDDDGDNSMDDHSMDDLVVSRETLVER